MKAVRQALVLAGKDLRLFVRDRFALVFAIAFPILFIVGFSLAFRSVNTDPNKPVEVVLVSEEGQPALSRQVIDGLVADPNAHMRALAPADARAQVDAGTLGGFILFPQGFSDAITGGQPAQLRVVTGPDAANTQAMLEGVASSIALDLSSRQVAIHATLALVQQARNAPDQAALGRALQALTDPAAPQPVAPITVRTDQVGAVQATSTASWLLPGYLTMFVFFAAGFSAEELLRERDNHTLDRLLASGVSGGTILAGKWLGTGARAVVQATVLWTAGVLFFHVDMGAAPFGTILITLGMIAASASFGLFVASLAKTARSANSLVVLAALVMAPLGGSWWPLFIMPHWMQTLARITPHAWANDAFNRLLLFGASTSDVLPNLAVLLGVAAIFGAAGFLRVRVRA
ncbi:MAG TPA: ABC transporter permease [Thermomicrobiaceae bacterium]|nr:ABC transporter permease [Thermomicrobiaceae bacterium]